MIISHKHKFIFIKNRKVAGTSVEKALATICCPEDVLTLDHLHTSEHDALADTARNYDGRFNPIPEILSDLRPMSVARAVRDWKDRPVYYNHMRANAVRGRIGRDVWDSYYKFCFERNPWDKTVSFYFWYNRSRSAKVSFDAFVTQKQGLLTTTDQILPTDWDRYTAGNQVIVDDVYRFEDLKGGLETALDKAGVAGSVIDGLALPKLKSNLRKPVEIGDPAACDSRIGDVFGREIALMGYERPATFA